MKISLITTVLNEQDTIKKLLDSILAQSLLPFECIVVDGGSSDNTTQLVNNYTHIFEKKKVKLRLLIRSGNRSIGRNEAVMHATGDIITCTDAGCILDKDWLKQISTPFSDPSVDVVAGYYQGKVETIFQKCLVPYVLVMQDKVTPDSFLPASRSLAFKKKVWQKVKGFPVQFSHNEDYVFAKQLQKTNAKIVFQKKAIVYWLPRKTFREAYTMFFRFALGDAEAGIFRPKVLAIFFRYLIGILLLLTAYLHKNVFLFQLCTVFFCLYILWAIQKNYKYVHHYAAFLYLPLLQLISDVAVILGTSLGSLMKIWDTLETQ